MQRINSLRDSVRASHYPIAGLFNTEQELLNCKPEVVSGPFNMRQGLLDFVCDIARASHQTITRLIDTHSEPLNHELEVIGSVQDIR